jgi:hypothetical protein
MYGRTFIHDRKELARRSEKEIDKKNLQIYDVLIIAIFL